MTPDMTLTTTPTTPQLLTPVQLAEFLQLDPERLSEMRSRGTGPAYIKIGRDVRYAWHDVRAWLAGNTRTSTRPAS